MPAKKQKGSKAKAKKPDEKEGGAKAPEKKEEGNFLVLSCAGREIRSGTKFTVVNVCMTQEKAIESIKRLINPRPEYLCVVEKKAIYTRRPKIVVEEIK